jgi:hypothetical protein
MKPHLVLLGAVALGGCSATATLPASPSPFGTPAPSPARAEIVHARGALVWRGQGDALPPGAREIHRGEDFHPGDARILLLDTAPVMDLCSVTGSEPGVLLAASCNWREGSTASVQSISITAGVVTKRSAALRIARTASSRGALGVVAVEDDPETTLRGGEIPALLCE